MKFLTLIFFMIMAMSESFAGLPPTTLGSQNGGKATTFNFQVPKKQATKVNGASLIETGNKNILENPSFEHQTASTGWNLSLGMLILRTSESIDGPRHLELSLSGESLEFYQDSTIGYDAFSDGVQGLAYIYVKTALSNIYVCARNAGVREHINKCVPVTSNNKWGLYKVPFILGGTSNGVGVYSLDTSGNAVAVTGSVKVDDAFVGAQDLKQDVDQSRIAGESFFAGTASAVCSRTSTTLGSFSCDAAFPGPTIAIPPSMGQWQTTDANLPRQTINNLPAGTYKATFHAISYLATGGSASLSITDGSTTCVGQGAGENPSYSSANTISCTFTYSSPGNRSFELVGASTGNTFYTGVNVANPSRNIRFQLEYFANGQVYSATNANTDWQSCGHTASDFIGFGTPTSIETQCKRDGGDLLMKGKFIIGTPTATEARLALKFNGSSLASKNSSVIPSIQQAGDAIQNGFASTYFRNATLIEPSVGYITFGHQASATSALTKMVGTVLGAGTVMSFNARIPINGWDNSNQIIGTFKEVVTTPGVNKPEFFSLNYSNTSSGSDNCSSASCFVDAIGTSVTSMTRSSVGSYVLNLNKTFTKLKCVLNYESSGSGYGVGKGQYKCSNCSSLSIPTPAHVTSTTTTSADSFGTILCHGSAP